MGNLLLTTDRTLRELSIEVGFKDYNNVARTFKKYKRISPNEYRKKGNVYNPNGYA